MLTRCHRLTSSQLFTRTVRRGRRAGTPTLVVHLHRPDPQGARQPGDRSHGRRDLGGHGDPGDESGRQHGDSGSAAPLVGFVVSRAVGPAVTRNLVKRRLRHLVRERVAGLPTASLLVVRALPAAAGATYETLGSDLDVALRRVMR